MLVSTSVIAYAEARAAFNRQMRERRLTTSGHEHAKKELEEHWPRFLRLSLSEGVSREAGELAEKHGLRGFDSLHLTSYLSLVRRSAPGTVAFSSFDESLNRAAQKEVRKGAR